MAFNKQHLFEEDLPAQFDGIFNWDYLDPAFRAKPSMGFCDVDGEVHRKGHWLQFETKNRGVPLNLGQIISINDKLKLGCITVFHLEGKQPDDLVFLRIYAPGSQIGQGEPYHVEPITPDYVVARVRWWFRMANGGTLPGETAEQIAEDEKLIRQTEADAMQKRKGATQ